MNDDALVDLIAQKVRARLMAGGTGPGYTRSPLMPGQGVAAPKPSLKTHSAEELRVIPCDADPADPNDCTDCGMCVVRRPQDAIGIARAGADRIGAGVGTGFARVRTLVADVDLPNLGSVAW